MPSVHYTPLTGAALKEFYDHQAEKHHDNGEGANDDSNSGTVLEPVSDFIVSSRRNEKLSSSAGKYAADCDARKEDIECTYTDKDNHVYNNPKRGEEGYLSDTILDEVLLNCDYAPSSETHDHALSSSFDNRKRQNETMLYEEQDDIISNEVNSRIVPEFESTLPNRKKFKSHHACTHYQQGEEILQERGHSHPIVSPTQYTTTPLSAALIGNSGSSYDANTGQDTSLHDSSFFSEDEALCTNDTAASAALTEGTKGCEPKEKMVKKRPNAFEERLEQLKAFKAKHGHCNVKIETGDNKSLGKWCSRVRVSIKKIENNEAPIVAGLSEENIRRLKDVQVDWKAKKKSFEERLEELKAYKAKHGHSNPKTRTGDDTSLGKWCAAVRVSINKMKKNGGHVVAGLSEDNIRRFQEVGLDWKAKQTSFEERFEQLKVFKAKYGHCNVKTKSGNHKSLGYWCWRVRVSINNMKNNEPPAIRGLSEDNIRRLKDVGFEWKAKQKSFEERLEELKVFKVKYGHCNVNTRGDDKSLGHWCRRVRVAIKKMKNKQAPIVRGLSEDNIRRLKDTGFDFDPAFR